MRIIRDLTEFINFNRPVLSLGTFDGVHLGHQKILSSLVKNAKEQMKESVLFSFDPHPRSVLDPSNDQVKMIDTLTQRIAKLERLGLDTLILFPFTKEFAQLSAEDFVKQILVDKIGISEIHVGYDHHFGKNRSGNFEELVKFGEKYNFKVQQYSAEKIDLIELSSTRVRAFIANGEFQKAETYLGSEFWVQGKVIKGKQIGRTIGFPTANVDFDTSIVLPSLGVYPVDFTCKGILQKGVANLGMKPTVSNDLRLGLEVFIFDFDEEIYDEIVEVRFHNKIRNEQKFESIEALKLQLKKDEENARSYFSLQ